MRVIEITEKKRNKLAEYAEKMLRYGGKLMQCLEELDEDDDMGYREESGYRGNMGNRHPEVRKMRKDDWDDDDDMGERRNRNNR